MMANKNDLLNPDTVQFLLALGFGGMVGGQDLPFLPMVTEAVIISTLLTAITAPFRLRRLRILTDILGKSPYKDLWNQSWYVFGNHYNHRGCRSYRIRCDLGHPVEARQRRPRTDDLLTDFAAECYKAGNP